MKKYTRKLTKTSTHSFIITLPKAVIKKYKWRERQKLSVTDKGRGLIEIRDWKKR